MKEDTELSEADIRRALDLNKWKDPNNLDTFCLPCGIWVAPEAFDQHVHPKLPDPRGHT